MTGGQHVKQKYWIFNYFLHCFQVPGRFQYKNLPCKLGTLLLLGTGRSGPLLANCWAVETVLSRYGRKLWREQYFLGSTHCKQTVHFAVISCFHSIPITNEGKHWKSVSGQTKPTTEIFPLIYSLRKYTNTYILMNTTQAYRYTVQWQQTEYGYSSKNHWNHQFLNITYKKNCSI
jgi:hypothetical protein